MKCKLCRKNVALVKARVGSNTVHICIPCAIAILEDDSDIELALEKRGLGGKEMEERQVEKED